MESSLPTPSQSGECLVPALLLKSRIQALALTKTVAEMSLQQSRACDSNVKWYKEGRAVRTHMDNSIFQSGWNSQPHTN